MNMRLRLTLTVLSLVCVHCARESSSPSTNPIGAAALGSAPPARSPAQADAGVVGDGEELVTSAAGYTKLIYTPAPSTRGFLPVSVTIDLTPQARAQSSDCGSTDDPRVARVRELLQNASVCRTVVKPGFVSCLAIAPSDIALENAERKLELSPKLCASGRFLCAGADDQLRALLADISVNSADACR